MPIYEYKGQQYDITTEDPAEAKAKILGFLEKQPLPPAPKVPDFAGNPALSPQEQVYATATPSSAGIRGLLTKPFTTPQAEPILSPEDRVMGAIGAPSTEPRVATQPKEARPPSEARPMEELGKGVESAAKIALPSMWEQAGIYKDVGALGTVQKRLDLFKKIETGEITSPDQLRGLDISTSQARAYFSADPAMREKIRDRTLDEIGRRKEFVSASLETLDQYQKDSVKYKGRTTDLTDVENVKDFANWLGYNVGSGAVQMAPIMLAAVTTGPGGVALLGAGMGTAQAVDDRLSFLKDQVKDMPRDKRADAVIDYVTKTGDTTLAVGIINGMLDSVLGPDAALAKRGLKQVVVGETKKQAFKAGVKEVPKQMAEEFLTGGAQQATQIAAQVREKEQKEFLTEKNLKDILNAAAAEAAGAISGGAITTGARVYGAKTGEQTRAEVLAKALEEGAKGATVNQTAIDQLVRQSLSPDAGVRQGTNVRANVPDLEITPPTTRPGEPPAPPSGGAPITPPAGIAGLTAAPSESMDTEAMLREALGQAPTITPVRVEEPKAAFNPTGWTQKENKINEKTGEPIYQLGTMVFEKTDESGNHRVVTRNGKISQSTTNSPVIEIINSYLTSDEDNGKISGKIQIDNKTGKLIFVEDGERGQVIKMSPRAEQQYKEGVPLEKIAETEFSDAGGIRPDGTRTPHTTTAAFKAKKPSSVIPTAQQPKTSTEIQPTVAKAGPFVRKQMEAQAPTTSTPVSIEGALSGIETPKAKQTEAQGEQASAAPAERLTLSNLGERPIEEQKKLIDSAYAKAPDAVREGRITQEQYDRLEAEKARIDAEYKEKAPKKTLTPFEQEISGLADQIESAGEEGFADAMRESLSRGMVKESSLPFYKEKLQEFQAKQGKTEAKEEGFNWSEFLDPNEQKYYDTFQKTASPEAKVAFDKVESSIQDVTKALNNLGFQVNDKKFPLGLGNLKTQYSHLLSDGLKLLRDHYAIQKEYKRADADKFNLSIKRANDSAAQTQQVIRKAVPRPQEVTEAEQRVTEGEKAVSKIKGKPGRSLWTALTGKLGSSDVAELFGKSLQIYQKKLQAKKDTSSRSIADMVSDGDLDDFLPFQMRSNVPGFDGQDAEEYIKEQVRGQNYIPYDAQVEIEQIFGSVEEAEKLINDYLTIEEQNLELQEAADEQRQGEINARSVEPESEIPSTEPDERETLTKPTPEGLRAKEKYRIEEEAKEAAEAKANKEAGDRAKADKEVGEFTLTGSDRAADIAVAQGQKDIFGKEEEEPKTNNPVKLGEEFPEIGADVFASIDASNKEIRDAISKAYKAGDVDEAMNILENMPRNKAAFEKPEEDGVKVVPFEADSETVGKLLSETREEEEPSDIRRNALMHSTEKPAKPKPTEMLTPEEAKAQIDEWKAEAVRQGKANKNYNKTILSLFDASGEWAKPWQEAGYDVHTFDIQTGEDINDFSVEYLLENGYGDLNIWGILAAPPCTDFASSGAQFWAKKDAKGQTEISNELVMQVIRTVNFLQPKIWAMENPVGRIAKLNNLPPAHLTFDPNLYGDPYTKKTLLWGNFENNLPLAPVEPTEGSKIIKLSGKDKYSRSLTPEGFAYAFFMANNAESMTPTERLTRTYYGVDPKAFEGATEADEKAIDSSEFQDKYYDGNLEEAADIARDIIGGKKEEAPAKTPTTALATVDNKAILKDALRIHELKTDLENISADDGKKIEDYSAKEIYSEAKYILEIFFESGTMDNDAYIGEHGPEEQKAAKDSVKKLQALIKKYADIEVLEPKEKPAAPRLTNEPYTIEGEFTEIGEEKQHALLSDQTSKLSEDQNKSLESQYGAKRGSAEFLDSVRKDVIAFITEGAKAVNGKIRAIIKQIATGVLSVAIVFNPQFVSKPYTIAVPQYDIKTSEVIKDLPKEAQSMSDAAKRAYGVIYPALEAQLKANDKLFIVADKRSGNTYLFNPDGSLLLQSKTLFGKAIGDYMHGDNEIVANRITPAGVFDLGLRDAKRSAGESYTAGDYDFGKVFVLDKSHMGSNGPYSNTIMHSVWTHETDAKQRLAALDKPGAEDSRYSFGCINVNKETFKYLIANHLNQMDGAKIFIVPENGANVMDFINGKAMNSDDIIRQKVEPVTKTTVTEKQVPAPKPGIERKQTGRETEVAKLEVKTEEEAPGKEPKEPKEQTFYSVEGKKLPPGRSPELSAAAKEVKAGRMSAAEFDKLVNKYRPIYLYQVPLKPATSEQMVEALSSDKKEKINPTISDGTRVGLRLDIPAFNRKGVYVVSIHEKGNKSGPGKVIGYDSVAVINNVTFGLGSQTKALDIATGASKDALQTMEGEYVKTDPSTAYVNAVEAMNDPAWTQIAVDPTRHAYFYDRNTTQPVIAAEQVIQIGNMVLAKNVTYGDKADYLYNIGKEGYANEEQKKRSDSLKRTIKTLNRMRKDGRITDEQFVERADAAIAADEEQRLAEEPSERKRGFLHIQTRLNQAVLAGDMSREARDLATWFMVNNEDLVSDLGVSIIGKGKPGQGGQYNAYKRIMTVIKNGGSDLTTVHEILHHLERMMPTKIQQAIRKAWSSQLAKAAKAAKTPNEKLYFAALMEAHYGDGNIANIEVPKGAEKTYEQIKSLLEALQKRGSSEDFAMEMLKLGMVPKASYEYFNPSEFWAVNGSDIVQARYDAARGGVLARLKNWLKEFAQKIKSLFGLKSDASIIRALDSLAKSDGKFVTNYMLGAGDYYSIERKNFRGNEAPEPAFEAPVPSAMDTFAYNFLDKQHDMRSVIDEIQKVRGELVKEQIDPYLKNESFISRKAAREENFVDYSIMPIVQEMYKNKVSILEVEEYMHNRHAEERNIQVAKINPSLPDGGSGIETAKALKYLTELPENKLKIYNKIARMFDGVVDKTQKILVESGAETQKTINDWNNTYEYYAPLQREDLDFVNHGVGHGGGLGSRGSFSKRAFGSTKNVANILQNIVLQHKRAIDRAERIRVGKSLMGLVLTNPNPNFWIPVNPNAIKSIKKFKQEVQSLGISADEAENMLQEPKSPSIDKETGLVKYAVNPAMRSMDNVFPVRINGQDWFIIFNPSDKRAMRMVKSLRNLDVEKLGIFLGTAGMVTRWISAINTQYNPIFGAFNFGRDVGTGLLQLSTTELAGQQSKVMKGVMPALAAIFREQRGWSGSKNVLEKDELTPQEWRDLYQRYRLAGGKTGISANFTQQKTRLEKLEKGWGIKGLLSVRATTDEISLLDKKLAEMDRGKIMAGAHYLFDYLSDYNEAMENAVRLATFKVAVLDNNMSDDKGASLAKNVTVNFDKKGAVVPKLQAWYSFINPGIRGAVLVKNVLTGPKGKIIIAGGIGLGIMQALLLFRAGFDDDDPPEFVKSKAFVIPTGDGKYFVMYPPYPPGFSMLPGIGRMLTEAFLIKSKAMKSNESASNKIFDILPMMFDSLNPFGIGAAYQQLVPSPLDPIANIIVNKDAFGRPIARTDRPGEETPGYERSRDNASAISKGIAYFLNWSSSPPGTLHTKGKISPTADQISYLAEQYFGGVFREMVKAGESIGAAVRGEEQPMYRVPVAGKFFGETKTPAATSSRFYDNMERMNTFEHEIKKRQEKREPVTEYLKDNPEARLWREANAAQKAVGDINKEKRLAVERRASKETIDAIDARKVKAMKTFNDKVRAAQ